MKKEYFDMFLGGKRKWEGVIGERSRGIEILVSDVFVKIKPTEPFRLGKQAD